MESDHTKRFRYSGVAGLSLVEVVVALALFCMVAFTLLQTVNYGLQALDKGNPDTLRMAMRDLRYEVLQITDRATVEEGGEGKTSAGDRFIWRAEVFPTTVIDYFQIELEARFPELSGVEEKREMLLQVYRPGWSQDRDKEVLVEQRAEQFEEQKEKR
jgi:hypothetical protein